MGREQIELLVDFDGTQTISQRLQETLEAYRTLAKQIRDSYRSMEFTDTIADTVRLHRVTKEFTGQLQYLRMNLGSLRTALTEAFAPIGVHVLPAINAAINGLKSFLHTLGAALAAAGVQLRGAAADNEKTAQSYAKLGSAAKASLADFDQIQRLGSPSGGSGLYDPQTHLTSEMKALTNKILQLLQPLLAIDLSPLKRAAENLWAALEPLLSQLGGALEWLWYTVAAPFITWCVEECYPALTDLLAAGLNAVNAALTPVITGCQLLWDALQPVAEFIGQSVITELDAWRSRLESLAEQLQKNADAVATVFYGLHSIITTVWNAVEPILSTMQGFFHETFTGLSRTGSETLGALLYALAGVTEFLAGIFTRDWGRAWDGILICLRGVINSLIGLLNGMLVQLTASLNAVVSMVSKVKITIPDWVPGLGGKVLQMPMQRFTAPQIPYLAKGAVLPANKPFLAMVGDQRHGTNIEAPLDTIRQALGEVLSDYAQASVAGQSETAVLLQQILEAVLGIEIGDETVGRAAARYQSRLAIMTGGGL